MFTSHNFFFLAWKKKLKRSLTILTTFNEIARLCLTIATGNCDFTSHQSSDIVILFYSLFRNKMKKVIETFSQF